MRIITGSARGRRLEAPKGTDTRPTSERVKEGIFSALQFETEGRTALDLFAGSGQLGLEALSRGAKRAVFVENDSAAVDAIRRNLARTGLASKGEVFRMDATVYLAGRRELFDIAFLDPPYASDLLARTLSLVEPIMSSGGVIVCETRDLSRLPAETGRFCAGRRYRYGKTDVLFYRRKSGDGTEATS